MRIVLSLLLLLPVFAHSVELTAELCSADANYYVQGGCPADLQAPFAGGNVTDTTADGSVQCVGANCIGIVHAYASLASSGTPSYADVLSGAGALNKQTDAIVTAGTSNFSFINLTAGQSIRITYAFEPQGGNYDNRPFDDLEVAADFPTLPGGGAPLGNARFVGPGGNDSNDGLSHATRWLTESKVNSTSSSLPTGTDIYFLTDRVKTSIDGNLTILHNGDGAGDSVIIGTYCMDGGTTEIAWTAADPDCGDKAVLSQLNKVGSDIVKQDALIAPWYYANAEGPLGDIASTGQENEEDPGVDPQYPLAKVFRALAGTGQTPQRSNDQAYAGSQAYKSIVGGATTSRQKKRSEVTSHGYDRFLPYVEGREYWWGAAFYFPTDWPIDDDFTVFWNGHTGSNEPQGTGCGPCWGLEWEADGDLRISTEGSGTNFDPPDLPRNVEDYDGQWVKFVIQFRQSKTNNGLYRVWMDDILIYERTGIRTVQTTLVENYYIKGGQYRPNADGVGVGDAIMYIDEIRYGRTDFGHGYEDVDPDNW